MKYSILLSIFSVVVVFGNMSLADDKQTTCTVTGPGGACATNSSGSGNGIQNSNGQRYIENGCEAFCSTQSPCGGEGNQANHCDCTKVDASDNGQVMCVSSQKLSSCGGSMKSTGTCTAKSSSDDGQQVNSGNLGPAGMQCQNDVNDAVDKCDPNKSSDVGAVMQMAAGAQQALSMATGSSIQAACGSLGKVSEAAAVATAAYKGYCAYSYSNCQKSCNDALQGEAVNNTVETKEIKKLLKQCSGMQQNIADAANAVTGLVGAKINMQQCAALTTDCTLNPTSAYCLAQADCTNATTAANNIVCICQANPADSRCGSGTNANIAGGFGGIPASGASSGSTTDGTLGQFGLGNGDGLGSIIPPSAGTGTNGQPTNLAAGMQGGHNLGNTGAVNNAYTPPGTPGSANGSKAGILSGYYGGSGTGWGSGSGSGSGSNNGNGGYGGANGAAGGKAKGLLDLKQFMPGAAKDPARSLAGESGPDGITGPNYLDNWQKANIRYNAPERTYIP